MSLVSNINRLIVKEITVTARYSAMADLSLFLYIYQKISVNLQLLLCFWLHIVVVWERQQQQEKININVFQKWYEKTYCEGNNFYCHM